VNVERHYEANLPQVSMDENFAEQCFINLAQNAYEAMSEKGGGTLRVSIARGTRRGHDGVEARFEDDGPGISREMREQIFNPFVTTKKTGVGLGLSIVSKIMDEHHGSIRLENDARGACFVLFFPASAQALEKQLHRAAAEESQRMPG
jgi:two-component system nitrogen regulation sensor histidine kinase GlnL